MFSPLADASATAVPAHARRGLFVTFEGGDGAGKSTQIELLAAQFQPTFALNPLVTREPGGTELGSQIRALLLHGDHVAPRAEALLYAADRAHHIETKVRPALERGGVVLQDRYFDSSIAYQGAGRELEAADIQAISYWATQNLVPDLTVLLDIEPHQGRRRRGGRGAEDRLEREADDFHTRVREHFLRLAQQDESRYLVLPADQDRHEIAAAVWQRVCELLRERDGLVDGVDAARIPDPTVHPSNREGTA